MTVIYNMSIDRADKPWIGDCRLTEFLSDTAAGQRPPWHGTPSPSAAAIAIGYRAYMSQSTGGRRSTVYRPYR